MRGQPSPLAAAGPDEGPAPGAGHSPRTPLPAALLAKPVLVIEDEALIAWMVESLLEDLGFETIAIAASAREARVMAGQAAPGLVISDINLGFGVPDGIETVTSLAVAPEVPIVFITAHANPANADRIEMAFARHAILAKPVLIEPLGAAILRLATRAPMPSTCPKMEQK